MRKIAVALCVVALAVPGLARAIQIGEAPEQGMDRDFWVKGQAGVETFTGEAAARTTPGAAYGVLVGADILPLLDAELGYQGAAYGTEGSAGNNVVENGGQALLMLKPTGDIEPYVFGGFGISRLSVLDADSADGVEDGTLYRLPVGAGVSYTLPSQGEADLVIGLRGTYDIGLNDAPFPGLDASSTNQFQGTLQIGSEF